DAATGTVTISNTGTLDALLRLSQDGIADVPGPGGGALSTRLQLLVRDVTRPSAPTTLFAGRLAAMPSLSIGALPRGTARTFAFAAVLPHGAGDDAFEGSSLSSRYVWTAVQAP